MCGRTAGSWFNSDLSATNGLVSPPDADSASEEPPNLWKYVGVDPQNARIDLIMSIAED